MTYQIRLPKRATAEVLTYSCETDGSGKPYATGTCRVDNETHYWLSFGETKTGITIKIFTPEKNITGKLDRHSYARIIGLI